MKTKRNKIKVKDFSKNIRLRQDYETEVFFDLVYNVDNKSKVLNKGLGISQFKVPKEFNVNSEEVLLDTASLNLDYINNVLYFKQYFPESNNTQHRILLHGSDKMLYVHQMYYGIGSLLSAYQLTFDSAPICLSYKLDGKDTIILSSPEKMVVWTTDLAPYTVEDVPIITSMTISNNVLFCTIDGEANKIWYCLSLNPELIGVSTDTTKFLSLDDERGYARKVLTFKENLYAFRDYGITRINYYDKDEITTTQVYLSDSKIYANTITSCGDVIMFMTRDGVYSFNGVSVTKQNIGIEKYLNCDNSFAVGACLQDKWFLGLRLNFDDDKKVLCENDSYINNALLVINLDDYSFEILRGVDIKSMMPLKTDTLEKMLVTFNSGEINKVGEIDDSGSLFGANLPKCFLSNEIMVEDCENLVIRRINIISSSMVTIKLITDEGDKVFVTTKDGVNSFQTLIPCSKFKIELSSLYDDFYIKYLDIEYYKK